MGVPSGFGSLVSESLRIAWRFKTLWLLGLLVGSAGGYGTEVFRSLDNYDTGDWGVFVGLIALSLFLVFALIGLVLRALAEGGLAQAGADATEDRFVSLGQTWQAGIDRFVGVFAIYLTSAIVIVAAAALAIVFPVIVGATVHPVLGVLIGLFVGPIFLGALLFWVPLASYALRFSALERATYTVSWTKAFTFVRRAPGRAIGLSLTRCAFLIVANVIELVLIVSLAGPIVIMWHLWPPLAIAAAVLVAAPILFVLAGYLGSAGSYYWTLGYLWTRDTVFPSREAEPESDPPPISDTPA